MRAGKTAHSRIAVVLLVAAAHVILLWLVWRQRVAHVEDEEAVGSIFFFSNPVAASKSDRKRTETRRRSAPREEAPRQVADTVPQVIEDTTIQSTTPEPGPGAAVDWQQQLSVVAAAVIEQGKDNARRAGALTRNLQPSAAFQPLHVKRHEADWYVAHTHTIYTASGVPVLVVTQPCAVVIFIMKDCTVDHIAPHGAFFEYMMQETDAALSYDGPNAVP